MTYEEKLNKADEIRTTAEQEAKNAIKTYLDGWATLGELVEMLQDIHTQEVAALKELNKQND